MWIGPSWLVQRIPVNIFPVFRIQIHRIRIQGLKKDLNVTSTQNYLTFYHIISFNWLLLMIKWHNYEIIIYYFQIELKKIARIRIRIQGSSGSGSRFLAGAGFNWIRIQNDAFPPQSVVQHVRSPLTPYLLLEGSGGGRHLHRHSRDWWFSTGPTTSLFY